MWFFGFNKDIVTRLLREKYKYDGIVCTDWGLITDVDMGVAVWPARARGVEKLSEADRVLKVVRSRLATVRRRAELTLFFNWSKPVRYQSNDWMNRCDASCDLNLRWVSLIIPM